MKPALKQELSNLLKAHVEKGMNSQKLFPDLVDFIEKYFYEINKTQSELFNDLIGDMEKYGSYFRWKRAMVKFVNEQNKKDY